MSSAGGAGSLSYTSRPAPAMAWVRSAWIDKGFRLGQFDLLAQLRSQQEQLDAEAQVQRAEHGLGRAISRFNQAAGVLP